MKILHLSTFDISGGAARAAHRLHTGLRQLGWDSQMFVSRPKSRDPSVAVFVPAKGGASRFARRLRRRRIKRELRRYVVPDSDVYEIFTHDRSKYGAELISQLPPCDLINLHWIASYVDYPSFFSAVCKPMVWTLHDMNPFTGGCHYDNQCGKWRQGCGACPQLESDNDSDLSRQIWKRKEKILTRIEQDRLRIVAPSNWLAAEVKRSPILGKFPVAIIPNGLDVDCFAPRDRAFARAVLGVPIQAKVVLCVSDSLKKRRKGFGLLAEALGTLKDIPGLFVISVGGGDFSVADKLPHLHLGFIENERFLSLIYSAADVSVIASLQDNLPNTVLESLACGTPVIGFDVGGIPDLIRPGFTGMLVPRGDSGGLCCAIRTYFENPSWQQDLSASCRRIAVEEFSLEICARRYMELYTQLAGSTGASHHVTGKNHAGKS